MPVRQKPRELAKAGPSCVEGRTSISIVARNILSLSSIIPFFPEFFFNQSTEPQRPSVAQCCTQHVDFLWLAPGALDVTLTSRSPRLSWWFGLFSMKRFRHFTRNFTLSEKLPLIMVMKVSIVTVKYLHCFLRSCHLLKRTMQSSMNHLWRKGAANKQSESTWRQTVDKWTLQSECGKKLLDLVVHLNNLLTRQGIDFSANIINRQPGVRCNCASLVNASFTLVTKDDQEVNYIAMHAVDLLPVTEVLSYRFPGSRTLMHSSSYSQSKYEYTNYAHPARWSEDMIVSSSTKCSIITLTDD